LIAKKAIVEKIDGNKLSKKYAPLSFFDLFLRKLEYDGAKNK